ncbi:MAG: pilus assembly protein PilP [Nitrospirota bacterium]
MSKRQIILASLLGIVAVAALVVLFAGKRTDSGAPSPVKGPAAQKNGPAPAPGAVPGSAPAAALGKPVPDKEPEKETAAAYEYTALGRRDPFTPLVVKADTDKKKGVPPIENYEVSEFKLIAVLWGRDGYYAVITLPDGKSYTIREGMRLGLHKGKVFRILRDTVVIREQVRDYSGVVSAKDTVLKLRREEEG